MVEIEGPQMMWRYDVYTLCAGRCKATCTYACTHRPISNTYCFSTATVICKCASVLRYMYIAPIFIHTRARTHVRAWGSHLICRHLEVPLVCVWCMHAHMHILEQEKPLSGFYEIYMQWDSCKARVLAARSANITGPFKWKYYNPMSVTSWNSYNAQITEVDTG